MKLEEVIQLGKPFKRKESTNWATVDNTGTIVHVQYANAEYVLFKNDVLADDWHVNEPQYIPGSVWHYKDEPTRLYIITQFHITDDYFYGLMPIEPEEQVNGRFHCHMTGVSHSMKELVHSCNLQYVCEDIASFIDYRKVKL